MIPMPKAIEVRCSQCNWEREHPVKTGPPPPQKCPACGRNTVIGKFIYEPPFGQIKGMR